MTMHIARSQSMFISIAKNILPRGESFVETRCTDVPSKEGGVGVLFVFLDYKSDYFSVAFSW